MLRGAEILFWLGCSDLTVVVAEAKGFERHMAGLGLRPGTKSIGVGILDGEGETTLKYRLGYDKDVSKRTIRQFAQRFIDKEEPQYVWSEPLPSAEEKAELAPVIKVRCIIILTHCFVTALPLLTLHVLGTLSGVCVLPGRREHD